MRDILEGRTIKSSILYMSSTLSFFMSNLNLYQTHQNCAVLMHLVFSQDCHQEECFK